MDVNSNCTMAGCRNHIVTIIRGRGFCHTCGSYVQGYLINTHCPPFLPPPYEPHWILRCIRKDFSFTLDGTFTTFEQAKAEAFIQCTKRNLPITILQAISTCTPAGSVTMTGRTQ